MTTKHLSVDVAVVGAGMVGLTLGNLLAQQGKSIAIVDRNPVPQYEIDQGFEARVTAVSPGSKAIFEHIHVWELMQQKRVTAFDAMHVWDEASDAKISFHATDVQTAHLGYIVENIVIQSSLHKCLQQYSDVNWLMNETVRTIATHKDKIEIKLESGQIFYAKLLVGADGHRSRIRQLADISLIEKNYQQRGLVALVQTEQSHANTAWQRFLSTGPLALLPLKDDQKNTNICSIVWSVSDDYADELMKLNEHNFADALTQASDRKLGNLALKSNCASFPLISGQVDTMIQPRIALVGDAAHALHPLAGQGANLGFTDAAVLADNLANTNRDIGSYKLLRKYERARIGETQVMQKAMDAFVDSFGSTNKPMIKARDIALTTADRIKPIKKFFMTHAMGLNKDRPVFAR